ncbi:MAG: hypothetical protein WAO55_02050 [Candidatus Manganitrophaceae bacterium]
MKLWVDRGFRGTPKFTRKRRADGEFEAFLRAPRGSQAGALIIVTWHGDLWVRLNPPHTFYSVNDQRELVFVVRQLLRERALFAVTYKDDVWTGTTLVARGVRPTIRRAEVAHVLSWSGRFDERLDASPSGGRSNKALQPASRAQRAGKPKRSARSARG